MSPRKGGVALLFRRWTLWCKVLAVACTLHTGAVGATDYWRQPLDEPWQNYLQQSARDADVLAKAMADELVLAKLTKAIPAVKAKDFGLLSIQNERDVAAVLSYQTVLGGWSKRTDMRQPRKVGQLAGSEADYIPTFDNGATSRQIRWLVAYYPQASSQQQAQIEQAVTKAISYLLRAQYPNGGFPQSYPLRGDYHDAVTLNDQVLTDLLRLLWEIAHEPQYQWLDATIRGQARGSFDLGVQWLLHYQVKVAGVRTVWAAQHHPLDGTPVAARKFEQISLVSSESAAVLQLLLDHAAEQPGVSTALCAGAQWLEQHAIRDQKWQRNAHGSQLIDQPGAVIWARFYSVPAQQPVFFDRDGNTYQRVEQLSLERQQGYGWYQSDAKGFLKAWRKRPELLSVCDGEGASAADLPAGH